MVKVGYDGRSTTPTKTHRFRLALALAGDRMRLEVLPPVGGSRLVVIADGTRLLALDPVNRRAEAWDSQGEGLTRLIGASLDASDLRTLLEGRSPCADGASTDGSCPFGGGRYRPGSDVASGGTDTVPGAELLDAHGHTVLWLDFPPPAPALGEWRRTLVLRQQRDASTIRLTLDSGPRQATFDPALLSTELPPGFEKGSVLGVGALSGIAAGVPEEAP